MNSKRWNLIAPENYLDPRGHLHVLDSFLPFDIQRVFWISKVPKGSSRGFHAHKTGEQILLCLSGKVIVRLFDGINSEEIQISPDSDALHMSSMVWASQEFEEENTVLLVFASNRFNEDDYIRNLEDFKTLTN